MIEVTSMTKRYPGTTALSEVDFSISPGEIVALAGENGSGKSTLLKILAGHVQPDGGDVRIDGASLRFTSPAHAVSAGIGLVEQELAVAPHLSVAENVLLGALPSFPGLPGSVNWRAARRRAREAMAVLDLDVNPRALLGSLPINDQQLVAIASVIARRPRLMLLDEATSSLGEEETNHVIATARRLRDEGMSIVFVSHRMAEMRQVADRIVVLRDGKNSGAAPMADVTDKEVVRMLVGRDLDEIYPPRDRDAPGEPVLEVESLRAKGGAVRDASLTVRSGEIVGIAGLVGSGRSTLAQAVYGAIPIEAGEVRVHGKRVNFRHPAEALAAGVGFIGENRKAQGIMPGRSIVDNIMAASMRHLPGKLGFVDGRAVRRQAGEQAKRAGVKYAHATDSITTLSGGNQQKVLIARMLMREPAVMLFDEPTRGVDVGAKSEIYQRIADAARSGMGALVISSELPELLGLCDTIYVLSHGETVAKLDAEHATEERIAALAFVADEEGETAA
ncbi:MAG: sugar ABC transporter ATP-binding protein [Pseudoclavibacter sp.]